MSETNERSVASTGSTVQQHVSRMLLDTSKIRSGIDAITRAFRARHSPLFSTRLRMAEAAEKWCSEAGVAATPYNVVTALCAMELVADQKRIREWLHV